MARWAATNNHNMTTSSRALKENDMLMGAFLSENSTIDLMQNCDLPPPLKVFPGSDKAVISTMNRVFSMMRREDDEDQDFDVYRSVDGESERLKLLKALKLSQTRAREAEEKAASVVKERDCISDALLKESLKASAYRQWVTLLEVQVLKFQQSQKETSSNGTLGEANKVLKEGKECGDERTSWIVALAFCLGIAFSYQYLF